MSNQVKKRQRIYDLLNVETKLKISKIPYLTARKDYFFFFFFTKNIF